MKKHWFGKSWRLAGLVGVMSIMAVLAGCGGGSSGVTPPPQSSSFAGYYIGTYLVANGPAIGQKGAFSIRIDNDGTVLFTSSGAGNTIIGKLDPNAALGTVKLKLPAPSGETFDIDGVLTRNADGTITGNGTFVSSDGTTGTVTLNSVVGTQ